MSFAASDTADTVSNTSNEDEAVPIVPLARMPAVAPLFNIEAWDVMQAAHLTDRWLRQLSGGMGFAQVQAAAPAAPALGNSMALVDCVADLLAVLRPDAVEDEWTRFAINLIGLYPGAEGDTRISVRVTLHYLRDRLLAQSELTDAALATLGAHVNSTHYGAIDTLADELPGIVSGFLAAAGAYGGQLAAGLAAALAAPAGRVPAFSGGALPFHYSEKETIAAPWNDLWRLSQGANRDGESAEGEEDGGGIDSAAELRQRLSTLAGTIPGKIAAQMGPLSRFLNAFKTAASAWRQKQDRDGVVANIPLSGGGRVVRDDQEGTLGALSAFSAALSACNPCKNGTAPSGTGGSIGFALGDETLSHVDFVLPGPVPFTWARTYNSRLSAYDHGPLGARWINEWTVRIDLTDMGLVYHAADGRSIRCPHIPLGERHVDPVEGFTLIPVNDRELNLVRGPFNPQKFGHDAPYLQIFERVPAHGQHPEHYRLAALGLSSGYKVGLLYDRRAADGTEVLSNLLVRQGETLLHHLATRINDDGRICQLHLMKSKDEPLRQLTDYFYFPHPDGSGDLIFAQEENAHHRSYDYRHHLMTRYADKTGRSMNLEWDGETAQAKAIREWMSDGSFDTRLEWDKQRRVTRVTDALGGITEHHYDIDGYTSRIVHPDKKEEWFFRDARKNLLRHQHVDGSVDAYTWDERDNLRSHTRPDFSTVWFEYDGKNNLTGIQEAMGGIWRREYDGKGNLTEQTDPLGHKTEYSYNAFNLPIEITDAKGGKKQMAYTPSGLLRSVTDCSGKTRQWDYDDRGRLISATNAAGATTSYLYAGIVEFDAKALDPDAEQRRIDHERQNAGQLEKIIYPDGSSERFFHDAEGHLLEYIDPANKKTEWRYSYAGLLQTRRNALGHTLAYHWDSSGRLVGIVNENGSEASFRYDPVGRVLEETGFDNLTTRYGYDKATGILSTVEDQDARHVLRFDPMGRVQERHSQYKAEHGGWSLPETTEYHWDGNGRLLLAQNSVSRLQWFHDAAGRVTAEHQHYHPNGAGKPGLTAVWRHAYDPLGNRIAMIRPDGHRVEHLTYGSGHVHGIVLDGEEIVAFERDDLHREIERRLGNGLVQKTAYDSVGRLKEQTLLPGTRSGGQLFKRDYRYDRAGQLARIDDSGKGQTDYRYDPTGRLLEALTPLGTERFTFDPAGNLLDAKEDDRHAGNQKPALMDNLLRDYAGIHYRYDRRGNRVEKIENGQMTHYRWNALNQLVEVETPQVKTVFAYDPLGRRILKKSEALVRELLPEAGSQYRESEKRRIARELDLGATYYGWDGNRLAWESKGQESIHYFYEPGSFAPIAQAVSTAGMGLHPTPNWQGRNYSVKEDPLWTNVPEPQPFQRIGWYHCDQIGTPQEISNGEGKIVWIARYKAWGEVQATAANGFRNPLRFQGQYFDHEIGLHYNQNRYYDPEMGRFISNDPVGFEGGLNLHQYAPNPVAWIDPLGLTKVILLGKSDPIRPSAEKIPDDDPNVCIVSAHGNSSSVQGMNAWQLNEKITMEGCSPTQTIKLDSCRTGEGANSIAEQLAKIRKTKVIAPDNPIWTLPWDKKVEKPYPPVSDTFDNIPNWLSPGKWRVFGPNGPEQSN